MHDGGRAPLVLLAAGGTAGHMFPAAALADALKRRGVAVELATDSRAIRYAKEFPARHVHVLPSETVRGRNPWTLVKTAAILAIAMLKASLLLSRARPAAVIGFGGYPTVAPVLAAAMRKIPTLIHEQNGVMGRANRLLGRYASAIATSFPGLAEAEPALGGKMAVTGNPVRNAVMAVAVAHYPERDPGGPFHLVVFGGSQGARIMADVVPAAVALLEPALQSRLSIVQQAREEDIDRVRQHYQRCGVRAEVASFFADLPARIAAAHLAISRSGASTVAELAAIGRPAILVPLPHAIDQDQRANADVLGKAAAALVLEQSEFVPERLAREIARIARDPVGAAGMAAAARAAGSPDAAERLADLVMEIAGITKG